VSAAPERQSVDNEGERSIHAKLGRVRRPRIHITYDVAPEGAVVSKALPFVIGVLADLSGHGPEIGQAFGDRRFMQIDRDNFDDVLRRIAPRLAVAVSDPSFVDSVQSVSLAFEKLDDFGPAALASQLAGSQPGLRTPEQLATLVNRVLHHPDLQRLESAWRGLHYLVSHCETGSQLKVRVLDVSKTALAEQLRRFKGAARDRSPLYHLLHDREFESAGGEPFGLLVADYAFDHRPQDVELLSELGSIGAAIQAPIVAGLAPSLLGLAGWEELAHVVDVEQALNTDDHDDWRCLREAGASRFICLTLPRVLARRPYGPATNPTGADDFEEDVSGPGLGGYVWMNAAYVMAANVANAFSRDGWPGRIRGLEGGGAAEGLPAHTFDGPPGRSAAMRSLEVLMDDRRELELNNSGCCVIHSAPGATAAFLTAPTLHKPLTHDDPQATVSARLGAQLSHLLILCRFAQHIRCWIRDDAALPTEMVDLDRRLNRWLSGYVASRQSATERGDHRTPLVGAQIRLEKASGQPRRINAKLHLQPHYQLEKLNAWLEMDFQLPQR
jgi:type VI secretion system protein ImpC